MPLSEHEQRVLAELEESLTRQDPHLAKTAHTKNVYVHAGRRVRRSILGFVVGLVVLVSFFSRNIWLGLLGVAIMFLSAIMLERNVRLLGKASWRDATRRAAADDVVAPVGTRTALFRDWMSRYRHKNQ
jgi:tetrahydromethanopterin S-methyltransferase subunit B